MGVGIPMPHIHLPQHQSKETAGKMTVVSLEGTLRSISDVDVVVHTKSDKMLRFSRDLQHGISQQGRR